MAKAAELSGRSLLDFIEILKSRAIAWGDYSEEQLRQDDAAVAQIESILERVGESKVD